MKENKKPDLPQKDTGNVVIDFTELLDLLESTLSSCEQQGLSDEHKNRMLRLLGKLQGPKIPVVPTKLQYPPVKTNGKKYRLPFRGTKASDMPINHEALENLDRPPYNPDFQVVTKWKELLQDLYWYIDRLVDHYPHNPTFSAHKEILDIITGRLDPAKIIPQFKPRSPPNAYYEALKRERAEELQQARARVAARTAAE